VTRQEEIRREVLLQLYGCRPLTQDADSIHRETRKQRQDYGLSEIKQELVFLADEGLLIEILEPGTTYRRYRIHANGVRHYEQESG
jgi:Fe2+ or Zn2+ uptake regulation protein